MVDVSTFYIDDSGTRHPDHKVDIPHHGHDWFALGGVLIDDELIDTAKEQIARFRSRWPQLGDSPLHSYEIRGKHDNFAWLGENEDVCRSFIEELQQLLFDLPVIGLACVIDRPGYNSRYREKYGRERWSLCKTAFDVVVERAAKLATGRNRKLRIYVERSSKEDDRKLQGYYDSLKNNGHSFNATTASVYNPLVATDYKNSLYEFKKKAKTSQLMQIADLYLWPICIGGYDKNNRAYTALTKAGKLIDCTLNKDELLERGIKYSCFDLEKQALENEKAEKR